MMKFLLSALLSFATVHNVNAQDYLDAMAKRSCECVEKLPENINKQSITMQVGFCILQSASPDDKLKILKDHQVDMNNPMKDGQKTGELVGARMASVCPATLIKLSSDAIEARGSVSGKINKVDADNFVVFSLQDASGKVSKYIWLTQVNSNLDLAASYKTLIGKTVKISFETKDVFDPKIGEYRPFKIITNLQAN